MLSSNLSANQFSSSISSALGRSFSHSIINFSTDKLNPNNQFVLSNLRQAAKDVAKEFPMYGLQRFFERWGDHIYNHGMKITDPDELHKYASTIDEDINELRNQAESPFKKEIIYLDHSKNNKN